MQRRLWLFGCIVDLIFLICIWSIGHSQQTGPQATSIVIDLEPLPPPPIPNFDTVPPEIEEPPPLPPVDGSIPPPSGTIVVNGIEYASDQLAVKFLPGTPQNTIQQIFTEEGLQKLAWFPETDWYFVRTLSGDALTAYENLLLRPEVEIVQLIGFVEGGAIPVDEYYPYQWYLQRLRTETAWDQTLGYSQYYIAILDTGIDSDRPDLVNKIARTGQGQLLGYNAINPSQYPEDDGVLPDGYPWGHGSFVSGIAAAETSFSSPNTTGIAGTAPNCFLLPIKVLDRVGRGYHGDTEEGIAEALRFSGVKVINMSYGAFANDPQFTPKFIFDELEVAKNQGILLVSVTHNDRARQIRYPAAFWNVMAVGASNYYDQKASYSNYGPEISLVAPGGDPDINGSLQDYQKYIFSTIRASPYFGYGYGTSLAAPQVSGLAALLFSRSPSMIWRDAWYRLEDTADDIDIAGWDERTGWGRVNGGRALSPDTSANYDFPLGVVLLSFPIWHGQFLPNAKDADWLVLFSHPDWGVRPREDVRWYDPISGRYLNYLDYRVPRVGCGKAFWVRFRNNPPSLTWLGAGAYKHSSGDHLFPIPLKRGWNLIGCPALNSIRWSVAAIKTRYYDDNPNNPTFGKQIIKTLNEELSSQPPRWVEPYAWAYNPQTGRYEFVFDQTLLPDVPRGSLEPFQGYWIYAHKPCELLLPAR